MKTRTTRRNSSSRTHRPAWLAPAVWALLAGGGLAAKGRAEDWPILLRDDFESGAAQWTSTDPQAWRIEAEGDNHAWALFQQSKFQPPHRSPVNIARLERPTVGDFRLEVRVRSTARQYGHRDLCLFFGYQDPAHFYYVHLGQKADDHANQIFIVNDAPRTKISLTSTAGTNWDDAWHQLRLVRRVESGDIAMYFDDLEHPVMTANDRTFPWGQVGLGSFDDTGLFDDFELRGLAAGP